MTTTDWAIQRDMLTFLVTDDCTAKCAHCLSCSWPGSEPRLSAAQIMSVVKDIITWRKVRVVVFTGGEPTLLGDELLEAIAEISNMGILTRMVTNAHWASSPEMARQMIATLRESGLGEINFSADDFHAQYVPVDHLKNAYDACQGQGFQSVVMALAESPETTITSKWIQENIDPEITVCHSGEDDVARVPFRADGTRYMVSAHGFSRVGRGRGLKGKYFVANKELLERNFACGEAMGSPVVDAEGRIAGCCGLRISGNRILHLGNALDGGPGSFQRSYQHGLEDPILKAIGIVGPKFVLDLARRLDPAIKLRDGYANICEICEDLAAHPETVERVRLECGQTIDRAISGIARGAV